MISVDVRLEAESINESNDWVDSGTLQRFKKETAKYKAFYALNSSYEGVFNNAELVISLESNDEKTIEFTHISPSNTDYAISKSGTANILAVNLSSEMISGHSGYIEFSIKASDADSFFNSNIFISGEFLNVITDAKEEFSSSNIGPKLEVVKEVSSKKMSTRDATDETMAYNSVSYIASARDEDGNITQYLPAFSPPAYAKLTFRDFDTSVGDFVWHDESGNGIQEPGEVGINNVVVQLLSEDGEVVYETVTANHPITGEPGYYLFEGVWPNTYVAKFPIMLSNGFTLTIPNQTGGKNSVALPLTGLTAPFTISDGEHIDTIDAGYLDNSPPDGQISGIVWFDLNHDGLIDDNEPYINGVTVNLMNQQQVVIATTVTTNDPNTGKPGHYRFGGLAFGEYYVSFPDRLMGRDALTQQHVGTDPTINSDANQLTGITQAIILSDANPDQRNINAGYLYTPVTTANLLVHLVKAI